MIIRSITLHVKDAKSILTALNRLKSLVEKIELAGYKVWTKRISLPPLRNELEVEEIYKEIKGSSNDLDGVFVAAFNFEADDAISIEKIVKYMENLRFIFSSMLIKDEGEIEEAFFKLKSFYSKAEYELHTRFASIYNSWILTPYFPASASISNEESFTVALRYAKDYEDLIVRDKNVNGLKGMLKELNGLLEEIASNQGIKYTGIDVSLSPWMEESVARIIENISKVEIPMPGTISSIRKVNSTLSEISKEVKVTGFNELMLPVEEDIVLKERAEEGSISLRDLISFSSFCVAGLDMVTLPKSQILSGNLLRNIVEDLLGISKLKNKPLGMRMILVEGKFGDKIDLGRFGKASIMKI